MALMRWKAWVGIAKPNGGMVRAGEVFVADENDPRCRGGRAKLLGPAGPERGPSEEVAQALAEAAEAATVDAPESVAAPEPEPEPEVEVEPEPEPTTTAAKRRKPTPVTELG